MADKPAGKRAGPKRAPPDMEQLLCAMLMLRGLPSGAEDWKTVASCMPDKADGSGEKPNHEAVRGMLFLCSLHKALQTSFALSQRRFLSNLSFTVGTWRRLKAKWEEEGIWGDDNDNALEDAPKGLRPQAKGKGKEKAKAPKVKKTGKKEKDQVTSDAEDGFEAEGSGTQLLEEDSDAGTKIVKGKTARAPRHQDEEGQGDGDEV